MRFLIDLLRPYQFKGKARLLAPFAPMNQECAARVFGFEMKLNTTDHIQRLTYLGAYMRPETKWVRQYLKPSMCFFDVGANIGYFTALGARSVGPTGKVFAIEPSPVAFHRLQGWVTQNQAAWVKALNIGLADKPCQLKLHLTKETRTNHSPSFLGPEESGVEVRVQTLDEIVEQEKVAQIDLMKFIVQGYEPAVLKGARELIRAGKLKALLCGMDPYWLEEAGTTAEACYELILSLGFKAVAPRPDFAKRHFEICSFLWT